MVLVDRVSGKEGIWGKGTQKHWVSIASVNIETPSSTVEGGEGAHSPLRVTMVTFTMAKVTEHGFEAHKKTICWGSKKNVRSDVRLKMYPFLVPRFESTYGMSIHWATSLKICVVALGAIG